MFVSVAQSGSATILHADLDSFYASVEQRDDPTLRGRPVIVGGGVVLAASYEAKAHGVRTAMGGRQALALCPNAVVVPPRMSAYSQASAAVFDVCHDTTPLVEPLSVDEAFLDVTGLRRTAGEPVQIAARLRAQVRDEVGLPITVGVARTKFLAKVASQEAKPDGLLLVPPGRELQFLHPLPVRRLWGVGAKTEDKLRAYGILTVAQVAELGESTLASMVGGAMGRQLYCLSRNIDRRRVVTGSRRRSVGAQRALGRRGNTMSAAELDAVVVNLVDRITRRMRSAGRTGRTVTLRLRFDDFRSGDPLPHHAACHRGHRTDPGRRPRPGGWRRATDPAAWADSGRICGVQYRPRRCPAVGVALRRRRGSAGRRLGGGSDPRAVR